MLRGDELEIVEGGGVRDGVAARVHVGTGGLVVLTISGERGHYVAFSVRLFEIIGRSERSELVEEDRLQVIQIRELRVREGDFLHVIIHHFQNRLSITEKRSGNVLNLSNGNKVRDTQGD